MIFLYQEVQILNFLPNKVKLCINSWVATTFKAGSLTCLFLIKSLYLTVETILTGYWLDQ